MASSSYVCHYTALHYIQKKIKLNQSLKWCKRYSNLLYKYNKPIQESYWNQNFVLYPPFCNATFVPQKILNVTKVSFEHVQC